MLISLLSFSMNTFAQDSKTRQEVKKELQEAQKNGQLKSINSEYNSFELLGMNSNKTRAQVLDELKQAQQDGSINNNKEGYDLSPSKKISSKTREQVVQELIEAQKSGELQRLREQYMY